MKKLIRKATNLVHPKGNTKAVLLSTLSLPTILVVSYVPALPQTWKLFGGGGGLLVLLSPMLGTEEACDKHMFSTGTSLPLARERNVPH